jgi:hypothetical protein
MPQRSRGVAQALTVVLALLMAGCASSGPLHNGLQARDRLPYTKGVEVGKRYKYQLDTHCGIRWAMIDGRYWETQTWDDGQSNPPPGWGNPWESGSLVVDSVDTARFIRSEGTELRFGPATSTPPPCS